MIMLRSTAPTLRLSLELFLWSPITKYLPSGTSYARNVFSGPERYLIYLMNKYIVLGDGVRIMTDTLMNIVREFSPGDYMPEELQ